MRVAVYYNNNDIRIEEKPAPQIGQGEILVKVSASGICGTDVVEWYRKKKAPRILGHEITGTIVESKSEKYKAGQRVFVSHHVPCNKCRRCLIGNHTACDTLHKGNYDPGGYSELIRVPEINVDTGVYLLPESVSDEEGTMIEPLACAIRGQRAIGVKKDQIILVLGCGVSGLLNIHLAKSKGARVIATDINSYRLGKAGAYGADELIDARKGFNVTADSVIICTGAYKAVEDALRCVDSGGTILFFAIPKKDITLPNAEFWRNELTFTSSYGAAPRDLEEALDMIEKKAIDIKGMITHTLPFENIRDGFKMVAEANESLKVVLKLK